MSIVQDSHFLLQRHHRIAGALEWSQAAVVRLPGRQSAGRLRRGQGSIIQEAVPTVVVIHDGAELGTVRPAILLLPALFATDVLAHGRVPCAFLRICPASSPDNPADAYEPPHWHRLACRAPRRWLGPARRFS